MSDCEEMTLPAALEGQTASQDPIPVEESKDGSRMEEDENMKRKVRKPAIRCRKVKSIMARWRS